MCKKTTIPGGVPGGGTGAYLWNDGIYVLNQVKPKYTRYKVL